MINIMARTKLHFNEMIMISTLYYNNMLSWVVIELAHWNNSLWVDTSLSFHTSWANQSLLLLLYTAYLAKKQQTPI